MRPTTSNDDFPALNEEQLTTIVNAAHDALFILRGESKVILHVNEAVERILGYPARDLLGTIFTDLLLENTPHYFEKSQFYDGVFGPVAFRQKSGKVCQADVTAAVIPWKNGPALLYTLRDATQRTALEEEKAVLIYDLQRALVTVHRLSGLLPICANCKRIRDDEGYWETVEQYITTHSTAQFSHGICPDCRELLYPDIKHTNSIEAPSAQTTIDQRFWAATVALENRSEKLDRVTTLRLHGLFQQGTLGDFVPEQVDFTDGAARARMDSWKALGGTSKSQARKLYAELVGEAMGVGHAPAAQKPSQ